MIVDFDTNPRSRFVPEIKNTENRDIGPAPTGDDLQNAKAQKNLPVLAVNFGPGLYRTFVYPRILKSFEDNGIKIKMLTGMGFGAVIATYYALGYTPEKIQWKIFKFLKKAKSKRVLSTSWMSSFKEEFIHPLKGLRLENTKRKLILPLYDKKKGKLIYFSRGSLPRILKGNLYFSGRKGVRYTTAFEWSYFNKTALVKGGADHVFNLNVLDDSLDFIQGSGLLVGIFSKFVGKRHDATLDDTITYEIKSARFKLDSTKELAAALRDAYSEGIEISESLQERLKEWNSKE